MSQRMASGKLIAELRSVGGISDFERSKMYHLMHSYYERVSEADFKRDLLKKTHVFLLLDSGSHEIQGFSTMLAKEFDGPFGRYFGAFSGDTIVQKEYWGQRALQKAFTRFMIQRKLEKPWRPLYWFLISKGYKTYLLLANNFWKHYPRFERPMPSRTKAILNSFYGQLFPDAYQPESGRVIFAEDSCRLKQDVAPITPEMRARNPRIDFFERANPDWKNGVELACMGEIDVLNPFVYMGKAILRTFMPRKIEVSLPPQEPQSDSGVRTSQ